MAGVIVASLTRTRRRLVQMAIGGAVTAFGGGLLVSPDCGDGSECVPGYVFAILLLAGWEIGLATGATVRRLVHL